MLFVGGWINEADDRIYKMYVSDQDKETGDFTGKFVIAGSMGEASYYHKVYRPGG